MLEPGVRRSELGGGRPDEPVIYQGAVRVRVEQNSSDGARSAVVS
jgi:hypothetical protein